MPQSLHHLILIYVSVFLSLMYVLSYKFKNIFSTLFFKAFSKSLSIFLLGFFILLNTNHKSAYIVFVTLSLASIGDFLLALNSEKSFKTGMISFLCAHLIYVFYFLANLDLNLIIFDIKIIFVAVSFLFSFFLFLIIKKNLNTYSFLTPLYMSIFCLMLLSMMYSNIFNYTLLCGLFLFGISDTLIALRKFYTRFFADNYLIWTKYYCAQVLISFSFLNLYNMYT